MNGAGVILSYADVLRPITLCGEKCLRAVLRTAQPMDVLREQE